MSIETIGSLSGAGMISEASGTERASNAASKIGGAQVGEGADGFAKTLGEALQKVDGMQLDADAQAEQVAMGGGNLHEMSLSLEKADISMRLAVKVRNKVVEAYQEIMRMSV